MRALIDTSHQGPFPWGLFRVMPQRNPIWLSWSIPHTTPLLVRATVISLGAFTSIHSVPLGAVGVIPSRMNTFPLLVIAQVVSLQHATCVKPSGWPTICQTLPSGLPSVTPFRNRASPSILIAQTPFSSAAMCFILWAMVVPLVMFLQVLPAGFIPIPSRTYAFWWWRPHTIFPEEEEVICSMDLGIICQSRPLLSVVVQNTIPLMSTTHRSSSERHIDRRWVIEGGYGWGGGWASRCQPLLLSPPVKHLPDSQCYLWSLVGGGTQPTCPSWSASAAAILSGYCFAFPHWYQPQINLPDQFLEQPTTSSEVECSLCMDPGLPVRWNPLLVCMDPGLPVRWNPLLVCMYPGLPVRWNPLLVCMYHGLPVRWNPLLVCMYHGLPVRWNPLLVCMYHGLPVRWNPLLVCMHPGLPVRWNPLLVCMYHGLPVRWNAPLVLCCNLLS